jgi:alkaline phosphatase D
VKFSRRDFLTASAVAIGSASMAGINRVFAQQGSDAVFRHGVASGDPLRDRVVLWTRVTPGAPGEVVDVGWMIARDARMTRPVASGSIRTTSARDYTVKLDAVALEPGTTYYYRFSSRGSRSVIGRTRTLPARPTPRARLAIVSCANFPFGFFNVYARIAARTDLNAVLHLGDYIYEYANGYYGNRMDGDGTPLGRVSFPNHELLTLDDYRARYAQYREDADLQAAHRQHPFIVVWDDHEFADDAFRDGAGNHQPGEGPWVDRKAAAIRAWREWMPVREVQSAAEFRLYRQFAFGDLADVMMLDTRIEGRDAQATRGEPAVVGQSSRQILGSTQEEWLFENLRDSTAAAKPWQILGQQVMFSPQAPAGSTSPNADSWDGYRAARTRVLEAAATAGCKNLIVFTGDVHSSWAYDIAANPFDTKHYDPATGQGSIGTELVTPAISSPPAFNRTQAAKIVAGRPHLKYFSSEYNGYLVVDLSPAQLQADWWSVPTVRERTTEERLEQSLVSLAAKPGLVQAAKASSPIEFR